MQKGEVKKRPILFNTEMVWAILNGRKTVTRRLMKPQPPDGVKWLYPGPTAGIWRASGEGVWYEINEPCDTGDILWVRETWTKEGGEYFYRADFDSDFLDPCETLSGGYPHECAYHPGCEGCMREPQRIFWRPSIHMPREAARIFLRVTDLRCERLHDISADPPGPENQVVREGFRYECDFIAGWERTIKPADRATFGWDANPWVWVIEFERISKGELAELISNG